MDKRYASFADFYPLYIVFGDWAMYRDMLSGRVRS